MVRMNDLLSIDANISRLTGERVMSSLATSYKPRDGLTLMQDM